MPSVLLPCEVTVPNSAGEGMGILLGLRMHVSVYRGRRAEYWAVKLPSCLGFRGYFHGSPGAVVGF